MEWIYKAHTRDYIEYLQTAYGEWVAAGGNKDGVLPEAFLVKKIGLRTNIKTLSPVAKAGLYCFDMSCTVTEGKFSPSLALLR